MEGDISGNLNFENIFLKRLNLNYELKFFIKKFFFVNDIICYIGLMLTLKLL